ncbi:unknown [Ruminococcus sp. CAG:403]|nr:unknown [Ruminococcus sp. CAG:403]
MIPGGGNGIHQTATASDVCIAVLVEETKGINDDRIIL